MEKKWLRALLSVIAAACIAIGAGWVIVVQVQNNQANTSEVSAQESKKDERDRILGSATTIQPTTTTTTTQPPATTQPSPATTAQTTAPSTTTTTTTAAPTTTTVPVPVLPARDTLQVNAVFGGLRIPSIGLDQAVSRANEADDGHEALEGGTAWFPSSSMYVDTGLGTNNLSMPGEGGNVAIGGHRGGNGRTGVFGRLHELNTGDEVVVETTWGTFTYKVTTPCHDGDQDHCTLSEAEILRHFAEHQASIETLFLFSCDTGMRIFVAAELVSAVPR